MTFNGTSLTTAKRVAAEMRPGFMLVQELTAGPGEIEKWKDDLANDGWRSAMTPSVCTEDGGRSAGVAILWQAFLNFREFHVVVPSRAARITWKVHGAPPIDVYSVYLYTGKGAAAANARIYAALFADIKARARLWLIGADWNAEPNYVAKVFKSVKLDTVILTGGTEPTCCTARGARVIDFYAAHPAVGASMSSTRTRADIASGTHQPVESLFEAKASTRLIAVRIRPPRLGCEPRNGPRRPTAIGECRTLRAEVGQLLDTAKDVNAHRGKWHSIIERAEAAFETWHNGARDDVLDAIIYDADCDVDKTKRRAREVMGEEPRYRLVPVAEAYAVPPSARGRTAAAVRWAEGRLRVIACIASRTPASDSGRAARGLELCRVAANTLSALAAPTSPFRRADPATSATWRPQLTQLMRTAAAVPHVDHFAITAIASSAAALADAAAATYDDVEKADSAAARAAYASWLGDQLNGGARALYADMKKGAPRGNDVDDEDLEDSATLLDADAAKWRRLWGVDEAPNPHDAAYVDEWMAHAQLANTRIHTAAEIRSASRTFKVRTAQPDGWHPRHFSLLGDGALDILAALIAIFVQVGHPPQRMQHVDVRLIGAKRRPIGLYTALMRLIGRLARPRLQEWQRQHAAAPFFAIGDGAAAPDAVWRSAVTAADCEDQGLCAVDWVGDLSKCYEYMIFAFVIRACIELGAPLDILRFEMATYRSPRYLGDGKAVAAPMTTLWRAVIAGSTTASYSLRALMFLPISRFVARQAGVCLSVYADDFCLSVMRESAALAARILVEALRDLFATVRDEVALHFGLPKCFVVGSSSTVVKAAAAATRQFTSEALQIGARLGIDYAPGRRVSNGARMLRKRRVAEAKRRLRRIRRFGRKRKMIAVAHAGALPGAMYGAEITACPPGIARELTRAAGVACGLAARGKLAPVAWAIQPGNAHAPPHIALTVAPLHRYCVEWYLATDSDPLVRARALTPPRLVAAFAAAVEAEKSAAWRTIAHSPVALAIRATRLAGWEFVDATHITDRAGASVALLETSPARVRQLFFRDAEAEELAAVLIPVLESAEFPIEERASLAEDGLFVDGIKRVLTARGKRALSVHEKRALVAFVTRSLVCGCDLRQRGYATDGVCPFCGEEEDTPYHRIVVCPAFAEQRAAIVPSAVLRDARQAGPTSLAWTRGWYAAPARPDNPHCEAGAIVVSATEDGGACDIEGFEFRAADGAIYIDGSAEHTGWRATATCAAAAVQIDGHGNTLRSVDLAWPSHLPQCAAIAERWILRAAIDYAPVDGGKFAVELVSDCMGVKLAAADLRRVSRHQYSWGGFWRSVSAALVQRGLGRDSLDVRWTKAHRSAAEAAAASDCVTFRGNDAADRRAKANLAAAEPRPADLAVAEHRAERAVAGLRAAARMLALWPYAEDLFGTLDRPAAPIADKPSVKPKRLAEHKFVPVQGGFQCTVCYRMRGHGTTGDGAPCGAVHVAAAAAVAAMPDTGHRLWCTRIAGGTGDSLTFVFCAACGAYADGKANILKRSCRPQEISNFRTAALRRLRDDPPRHPSQRLADTVVEKPWRVNGPDALAVAADVAFADVAGAVARRRDCKRAQKQHAKAKAAAARRKPKSRPMRRQRADVVEAIERRARDQAISVTRAAEEAALQADEEAFAEAQAEDGNLSPTAPSGRHAPGEVATPGRAAAYETVRRRWELAIGAKRRKLFPFGGASEPPGWYQTQLQSFHEWAAEPARFVQDQGDELLSIAAAAPALSAPPSAPSLPAPPRAAAAVPEAVPPMLQRVRDRIAAGAGRKWPAAVAPQRPLQGQHAAKRSRASSAA